jgi:AcrR family transcriptional regulator
MAHLGVKSIAEAALRLIDERGIDGFSIRAVAKSLDVTPMALYHHVRDKAALAELVVEAVLSEHPLKPRTQDWRGDLWAVAQCSRAISVSHPAVAIIRRTYDVWTTQSHELASRWMSHWLESGLDRAAAIMAASTSSSAISGLVAEELRERGSNPPAKRSNLPDLPEADLLLQTRFDVDMRFELGFNAVVDGLLLRLKK